MLQNPERLIFVTMLHKSSWHASTHLKAWCCLHTGAKKNQKSHSDVLFIIVCHSSCVVGSNIRKTKVLSQCAIVYSFLSWFFKFLRNYNTWARQILFFYAFVCGNTYQFEECILSPTTIFPHLSIKTHKTKYNAINVDISMCLLPFVLLKTILHPYNHFRR